MELNKSNLNFVMAKLGQGNVKPKIKKNIVNLVRKQKENDNSQAVPQAKINKNFTNTKFGKSLKNNNSQKSVTTRNTVNNLQLNLMNIDKQSKKFH